MRTTNADTGAEIGAHISDDETEAEWTECPQCVQASRLDRDLLSAVQGSGNDLFRVAGPTNHRNETGNRWTVRLARALRQLTQSRKAGSQLPLIGQGCLILRGLEGHDLGQAAVIILQTKARVRVAFVD
jgi:hypothetical protein